MADASYLNTTQLSSLLDQVFGPGKWRETGGYRSPEREDQLRAQGAATVPVGHTSEHSLGTDDAPGAVDLVVAGMTPQQAAAALQRAKAPFSEYIPEGSAGTQGAHLHVGYRQGGKTVSASVPDLAGGPEGLAPILQQIIAGSRPDAMQMQLFKQMQDRSKTSSDDLAASNQNLKVLGQKMASEHSPDPINPGDFTPPDKAKMEKDELAKVSDRPNDASRALGQFLPVLAILGGAFVKNGSIASLNAAAAAMNAARGHDQAAVEKAHTEFEDAMTELKTRMDTAKTVYDENRNKYGDDMAGFAAQQSIQEAQDKNDLAAQALATGNYEQYFALKNSTFAAYEKLLPVYTAMQNHRDSLDSKVQVLQDKDGTNYVYNAAEHKATTLDGQPYTPESAAHIQSGRPPSAMSAATAKFIQENPGATSDDIVRFAMDSGSHTAAAKAFTTGKQGDTVRSLNVSVAHLQTLRDLGKALQNGDITAINAAKQRFSEELGVPAPTNFDAAKSIVADEVAKGVIGGQSAQSDRETLAASLRKSGSPEVIDGAINTFQKLLAGQLGGLRQQYEHGTGEKNFDEFLLPETREALGASGVVATPTPMPKTKDALVKGTLYETARGPAIWNGDKFEAQ